MSESIAGLTGTESTVLLVLASAVEPVRNPDLKLLGPALEAPSRRKLVERGLLDVEVGERRTLLLSLTDRGWAAAAALLESPPPPRATPQLRALFTFAAGIGRYLRRESLALGEVVTPADPPAPAPAQAVRSAPAPAPDGPPADRVRAAYRAVAALGAWVALRDLRAALPGVPRATVDEGLRALYPEPGVHIVAEDNLKALTPDDHAAALQLGGRPLHAIRITR
ncbi:Uncharacterised protein (plasmid) [Tsukamurella tyrosinosolvens]|uniref:Winged helix DNA-binding domain-containing protein n=1 Tax=Tsukamurella tyrosinosolvens TaxID=57704 RepID=A0A1H4ZS83_TSUTY|nr:hypothetical protein [Tsukamurella tyrosinosolvens]KXO95542.1 hypothetical protein AXK58_12650 [Tsukamurella tyrosinosolvens]QRY84625.1 hypothetical protein JVY00_00430 [Tsukamurella tyrosinosolvens]SED32952.1 hypothetical protein SAMN04489793_4660 [Tsukamurella tyrosinosolvens]VEH99612.1 Uncharacterised protein [Tsukamurella tyrosinosolvens]